MTTLALDTATSATAVALCRPGMPALEARDDPPPGARPGHAARLLPLAAGLLDSAGLGWSALERIAVGTGPGTFTGLRIGLAAARALAQARALPIVGVPTLASLALGAAAAARAAGGPAILAVVDARRGEVFAAAWAADADAATLAAAGTAWLTARALPPEALAEWVAAEAPGAFAVGDGALLARATLAAAGACVPAADAPWHRVSAVSHCALATHLADGGEVLPEYIREPDARPRTPTA